MRLVTPAGSHHAIVSFGIALLTSFFVVNAVFLRKSIGGSVCEFEKVDSLRDSKLNVFSLDSDTIRKRF